MIVPAPSAHEVDILRAISCGISATDLQRMGPWTFDDIGRTMERHSLTVTNEGLIVPGDVQQHQLIVLAAYSPSPVVQQQAVTARAALTQLAQLVAMDRAGQNADDLRREQRASLQAWLDQLRQLETKARGELRRLREQSPRSRKAG